MIATRCTCLPVLTAKECTPLRSRRRDRPGRARHTRARRRSDTPANRHGSGAAGAGFAGVRWRGPDLNRRHHGFQPCALPTELPRPAGRKCSRTKRDVRTGATASRTSLCPAPYATSSLRARSASPAPAEKSATWAKPRCSRRARTVGRGTQIGVRSPMLKAIATRPPGPGHPVELVEERDHVVQRHEIEARVGERETAMRPPPRSARARAGVPRRSCRPRRRPRAPRRRATARRGVAPPLRFPCRRRARAPADRAATPAPRSSVRAARGSRASRPSPERAGRSCASSAGGRPARETARARPPS